MKEKHMGKGTTYMENGDYKMPTENNKHEMNSISVHHEKMHLFGKPHKSNMHHMESMKPAELNRGKVDMQAHKH